MKRSRINQREAARIIGVHYTFLNQILAGRRTPGLANAVTIERETGIPVAAWAPTEGGSAAGSTAKEADNSHVGKA